MIKQMALGRQIDAVGGLPWRLDVKGDKRRTVTRGNPVCFSDDAPGRLFIAADAGQNLFPSGGRNCREYFRFHFFLHSESNFLQCQFTQLKNIFRSEKIIQGNLDFFRPVNLAGLEAADQFLGRQVDIHHFVRLLQNPVGNPFLHLNPRNLLHFAAQAFDVLDINRGNHINIGVKQLHHVFPSLAMAAPFHIGMSQFVNNNQLGPGLKNRVQVHFFNLPAFVKNHFTRDDGHPPEHGFSPGPPVGFNVTDSDINAVIQQFMGFLQHAVRLAYSGHHTNVNLELSPSRTPYQVKKVLCSVTSVNHIKFTRLLRLKTSC